MKFLSLILAMSMMYYWRASLLPLQQDSWFASWCETVRKTLSALPSAVQWGFAVLLPALLAGIVIEALSGWLWGAVSLVLAVLLLLYSLGRGDLAEQSEEYLAAWQEGDWQAGWHHAQTFVSQEMLDETADPVQLHDYACRAMAYQGFERLFAVVFWFMILGPAGALLYRLASLRAQATPGSDDPLDQQMLYLLEWLPARLLALTFALAGNFNTTVSALELGWLDMTQSVSGFLATAVAGALQWTPLQFPQDDEAALEAFIAQGEQDLRALLTLLARCGMIWLAVIALWQILTIW